MLEQETLPTVDILAKKQQIMAMNLELQSRCAHPEEYCEYEVGLNSNWARCHACGAEKKRSELKRERYERA